MEHRHARRGNYAALFAFSMPVLLGFTALAFDISMLRLADSQAQDIADATAHGALIALRNTGETASARAAANAMVTHNKIIGASPVLEDIRFGIWEDDSFTESTNAPNAVEVSVARDVPFAIAPFMGFQSQVVGRSATAAAQAIHVVLVIDITNSWNQDNFAYAREASVEFFDTIAEAYGPDDRIGMVVFTGMYGVEHTPLVPVADAIASGHRDIWANLGTASKAGTPANNNKGCSVYGGDQLNDFSDPENGCFPDMWREYRDESGTDHSVGVEMATQMFQEHSDSGVYRAALVLTDGNPNGVGSHTQRESDGYDETRWRYIRTDTRRSTSQVKIDAAAEARNAYDVASVNTWAVSFVADASWMTGVVQGDGYYVKTSSASALVPIFQDIAESLPVALVK